MGVGQGPCVSLFSSIFDRFSAPAVTKTHLDRQGLKNCVFCTKNQPLTSILRPIRGPFLVEAGVGDRSVHPQSVMQNTFFREN